MKFEFKVHHGVKRPNRRAPNTGSKYPFSQMKVGDMFFVPGKGARLQSILSSSASYFGRKLEASFSVLSTTMGGKQGYGVWRNHGAAKRRKAKAPSK